MPHSGCAGSIAGEVGGLLTFGFEFEVVFGGDKPIAVVVRWALS